MNQPLRILSVEDDPKDTQLIQDLLQSENIACEMTRVETEAELVASLEQGGIDLILADYTLPAFDGISALKLVTKACPDVPFIFVSGTLGEEVAIEALKIGATDYILKTRLSRLVPSLTRALRESSERAERKQADEKLRRNEAYLAEAQKLSHTGSFGWDVCSGKLYWSEETFRILGCEPGTEATIELVLQRTHPEDRAALLQLIERVSRDATEFDIEHRLLLPDGRVKFVHVIGRPTENENGCVEFVGAVTDITERKETEEALRRSESYLEEAQKLTHTGSWAWEVQRREAMHLSDEWYRIFGFDPAEGMPTWERRLERVHPGDRAYWSAEIERAIREKSEYDLEFRIVLPDATVKSIHGVGRPVLNASGDLVQFVGFSMDITERKRAEEALHRSEAYSAAAQRLSRTGSFGCKPSTGEMVWSEETFRIFGYDRRTKPAVDCILHRVHPEDKGMVAEKIDRATRYGEDCDLEYRMVMPDGAAKFVRVVAHSVGTDEPDVSQFVGAVTDITERKRAEETLRRSEGYLSEAQRMTRSGSWAWNVRTLEVFWSREMFRIFDYDPEAVKPTLKYFLDRIHPDDRCGVEERARNEIALKEPVDSDGAFRIVLDNGTVKHLRSVSHPIFNEQGEVTEVVGTTMDVTEQWNATSALKKALEEINTLKDQLSNENIVLREEIDKVSMFEEIVGSSEPLRRVLVQVAKVATTDSTVLISGETGTGKEMIARAIHRRSKRATRAFVRVNCAAIPPTLIASELFGHEKGAFTGAIQRHQGRFELADGGTIFLDEIGELPAETQTALLRVLQEREFERVGGNRSIRVDVRILSATNRDLEAAVQEGKFRQDLFYRLNVFPIHMPPLRERSDDIPLLIRYLIDRYSTRAGKRIKSVDKRTMEIFQTYSWPGNIRELQNVVERAVVLCDGETFSVDETWLKRDAVQEPDRQETSLGRLGRLLPEQERKIIETALAESRGRVSGPKGAAALLGVPRQTLESKISTLGIDKYKFRSV